MLFNRRCVGNFRLRSRIQTTIAQHGLGRYVEVEIQVLASMEERVIDRLPEGNESLGRFQPAMALGKVDRRTKCR